MRSYCLKSRLYNSVLDRFKKYQKNQASIYDYILNETLAAQISIVL